MIDFNDPDSVARFLVDEDPPLHEREQLFDDLIGWHGDARGSEIWDRAANLADRGQR